MRLRQHTDADPDRDPVALVHAALDAGITMVDTADAYQNEELVGRAIRRRRNEVVLAGKFGLVWQDGIAGNFRVRADPAYVRQAAEASLRRLGVDVIDLYYLHHRSEAVPIEDTVAAMAELVDKGVVRALGLSNVTADDLRRAHAVHPITALQERWSLFERDVERGLLPAATDLGVTIVAHSPTDHGSLHRVPDAGPALDEIARAHDATPGQVALAWVHHRTEVHDVTVVPLPGTTNVRHLRINAAARDIRLTDEQLHQLNALVMSC
ncbi:aldo/keto reductase [Saccharopolyspora aridisoli]|uniref:Aldo/keto reductase n=1 Tax=Saccharopolyspora aridisoli TaxID=2530385 RepID=A0A4R4USM8_9PSEU|nr:aldo/keto reductase [Saccharopolyspora aridisoli]TDC93386.1 aldo/keto reductase [Saccharopolyspora aridisoli]